MSDPVHIAVHGIPAPKGSNRAIAIGGRGRLIEGGSDGGKRRMKAWAAVVAQEASLAAANRGPSPLFRNAALTVSILFRMARGKTHYGARGLLPSAPAFPAVKPDVDKLARSTLDALTGIVWDDDSRIVCLTVAKVYAQRPGDEGASITVKYREVGDADVAHAGAFAAVEEAP